MVRDCSECCIPGPCPCDVCEYSEGCTDTCPELGGLSPCQLVREADADAEQWAGEGVE